MNTKKALFLKNILSDEWFGNNDYRINLHFTVYPEDRIEYVRHEAAYDVPLNPAGRSRPYQRNVIQFPKS